MCNKRLFEVFFFQAEDGIRYGHVTGVQTCALPISDRSTPLDRPRSFRNDRPSTVDSRWRRCQAEETAELSCLNHPAISAAPPTRPMAVDHHCRLVDVVSPV